MKTLRWDELVLGDLIVYSQHPGFKREQRHDLILSIGPKKAITLANAKTDFFERVTWNMVLLGTREPMEVRDLFVVRDGEKYIPSLGFD